MYPSNSLNSIFQFSKRSFLFLILIRCDKYFLSFQISQTSANEKTRVSHRSNSFFFFLFFAKLEKLLTGSYYVNPVFRSISVTRLVTFPSPSLISFDCKLPLTLRSWSRKGYTPLLCWPQLIGMERF